MLSSGKTSLCARELQLRRETLAAMKLRSMQDRGRSRHSRLDPAVQRADSRACVPPALRVLTVSDYEGLRLSRQLILEQAGFRAESCTSSSRFEVFAVRKFHIAILCHSVPSDCAIRIAEMLHRYQPRICVVRLDSSERSGSPFFDRELDLFTPPEEFLRVVREEANRLSAS